MPRSPTVEAKPSPARIGIIFPFIVNFQTLVDLSSWVFEIMKRWLGEWILNAKCRNCELREYRDFCPLLGCRGERRETRGVQEKLSPTQVRRCLNPQG